MLVTHLPLNVSPKLAYTILTTVVAYVLTHYAISLDPDVAGLVSLTIASLVGYQAPVGTQLPGEVGPGSDSGLSVEAASELNKT